MNQWFAQVVWFVLPLMLPASTLALTYQTTNDARLAVVVAALVLLGELIVGLGFPFVAGAYTTALRCLGCSWQRQNDLLKHMALALASSPHRKRRLGIPKNRSILFSYRLPPVTCAILTPI
ncbi:MAG: hypothetical protein ACOYYS_23430 [Chloroflexota bacterium]